MAKPRALERLSQFCTKGRAKMWWESPLRRTADVSSGFSTTEAQKRTTYPSVRNQRHYPVPHYLRIAFTILPLNVSGRGRCTKHRPTRWDSEASSAAMEDTRWRFWIAMRD